MRNLFYIVTFGLIITLAYWAYQENVKTQIAMKKSEELQAEIGKARAKLTVLKAEWAYLNRPERLIHLTNLGFDQLKLGPIRAANFGEVNIFNQRVSNIKWNSNLNPKDSKSEFRLYDND
tara:strand:- start:190 stop:549 length:360 start_codon:yes stop_codon:yes gene_type:complete